MLQQFIMKNKKTSALILAGAAAFAYYKYSKMTPDEKTKFVSTLKEKGSGLLSNLVPGGLGNLFTKSNSSAAYSNQACKDIALNYLHLQEDDRGNAM